MIERAIQSVLELVGVPSPVAAVVGRAVPKLVAFVTVAFANDVDPEAELDAMLDLGEAGVIERERLKFGPKP